MPAALFTADNGKLVFEAVKLNGSIRLNYQGWEDTRTVHPGDRFVLEIGPSGQVQGFILPAMCEYCTEGLHTAREAFLRAENGAAPPRASLADVSGDLLEHGLEPRSLGNRNSATQWRGDWHPPKPESSGRQWPRARLDRTAPGRIIAKRSKNSRGKAICNCATKGQ